MSLFDEERDPIMVHRLEGIFDFLEAATSLQPLGGFATETAGGRHHPRHREQLRYPRQHDARSQARSSVITIPASAAVAAATYGVLVLLGIE